MRIAVEARITAFAKPRGSSGSYRSFRDPVEVEIREVQPEEAPIAMQWDGGHDGPMETRWLDGAHWFVFDRDTAGARRSLQANEILSMLADPMDRRFGRLIAGHFDKSDYTCVDLDRSKFVEFDDKPWQTVRDNIQSWAEDCIIIDGMLYTRCPEPMYHVGIGGIAVVVENQQEKIENRRFDVKAQPFRSATIFRADRYEEAVSASAALWPNHAIAHEPLVTVFVESSLRVDVDRNCLVDTCLDVLTMCGREPILKIPPAVLTSLAPLAACFWNTKKDEVDADEAHAALVRFSEAAWANAYDLSRVDGNPGWAVDAAIERWDNRPVALPSISATGGPRR
jgi:hypothetical protein